MEKNKNIKTISLIKNAIIYNANRDEHYLSRKGVLMVEYEDETHSLLDIDMGADLTNCLHLEVKVVRGKSKLKKIFEDARAKD